MKLQHPEQTIQNSWVSPYWSSRSLQAKKVGPNFRLWAKMLMGFVLLAQGFLIFFPSFRE